MKREQIKLFYYNCVLAAMWLFMFCVAPYGDVGWSAVCDRAFSWPYLLQQRMPNNTKQRRHVAFTLNVLSDVKFFRILSRNQVYDNCGHSSLSNERLRDQDALLPGSSGMRT